MKLTYNTTQCICENRILIQTVKDHVQIHVFCTLLEGKGVICFDGCSWIGQVSIVEQNVTLAQTDSSPDDIRDQLQLLPNLNETFTGRSGNVVSFLRPLGITIG